MVLLLRACDYEQSRESLAINGSEIRALTESLAINGSEIRALTVNQCLYISVQVSSCGWNISPIGC